MPGTEQLVVVQQTSKLLNEKIQQLMTKIPTLIFQADLDLLKQHYQLHRSYLSHLADWYSQRMWWEKILLGIGVVGGTLSLTITFYVLAGMTLTTLILVNFLILALCYSTTVVLANHTAMEEKRLIHFCAQVKQFESDLQQSIQSFQQIEERLAVLLNELNGQHDILDNYAQQLEKQVDTFNQEMNTAKDIIAKLNQVIETLRADTTSQHALGQAVTTQLQSLHESTIVDTAKMAEIGHQLTGNKEGLSESEGLLKAMNQALIVYNSAFNAQVDELQRKIEVTERSISNYSEDTEQTQELLMQRRIAANKLILNYKKV